MEFKDEDVELAEKLHGHLAPGIALGVRMARIALRRLRTRRGSKKLIAISETARCLADGMQAATGATLGHGNALVENYGKLALTVGRVDTGRGYRVALRRDAWRHSPLLKKWMMREGKLTRDEERQLASVLLGLGEEFLEVTPVKIELSSFFENSSIVRCPRCDEHVPEALVVSENGTRVCRSCAGVGYYRIAQQAFA
jgi:formylmethanofuran dehydrogenase subunit E